MINNNLVYLFMFVIFISSCKHEVVTGDIYAYWQLQNNVEFNDIAIGKLEVTDDENWGCWADPVVNDTIYHFRSFSINTDTLTFVDDNAKMLECRIYELHDSVMILTDFPGANGNLVFKRIADTMRDDAVPQKISGMTIYAKEYPLDSLDINMKSVLSQHFANYLGKSVILTDKQIATVREILREYVDGKHFLEEQPNARDDAYPFDEYFKQYMGYMKDGELMVDITMSRMVGGAFNPFPYMMLKQDLVSVDDGGPSHARAEVNLTKGKVIWFMTNGY